MITRDYLLDEMRKSANLVATKSMLDEDKMQLLVQEGFELITDIFDSLSWTTVKGGLVVSCENLDEWHHRKTASEIGNDWRYLAIDKDLLISSAEKYLSTNWINNKYLDWLFVNLLIYSEYQGFIDGILRKILSVEKYISLKSSIKNEPIILRMQLNFSFFEVAIWLLVLIISLVSRYALFALIAVTIWSLWSHNSYIKKANILLNTTEDAIKRTYNTVTTVSQSWSIVWEELNRSRSNGVILDGVLYRLVVMRMS